MKFATLSLLGVIMASTNLCSVDAAIKGAARPGGEKRKRLSDRKLKDDASKGEACVKTCTEHLPGYSFFGQNYLDDDFWPNIIGVFEGGDFPPDGDAPEYPEDYLVPGPEGGVAGGLTCYDNPFILFFCGLFTLISEAIYENDILRCILMNTVATARGEICLEQLERRRKLEPGASPEPVPDLTIESDLLKYVQLRGLSSIGDMIKEFGLQNNPDLQTFLQAYADANPPERKLDIDVHGSGDTAFGIIDEFLLDGALAEIDALFDNSDFEQTIRGNLFFARCIGVEQAPPPICAILFTFVKTIDATVCHYREDLGCGEEECTKDLAFDIAYNTERLAIDLPIPAPDDKFFASILSPCSSCLLEKSDGCSAFCPYYKGFHSCDVLIPEDVFGLAFEAGIEVTGLTIFAVGFLIDVVSAPP